MCALNPPKIPTHRFLIFAVCAALARRINAAHSPRGSARDSGHRRRTESGGGGGIDAEDQGMHAPFQMIHSFARVYACVEIFVFKQYMILPSCRVHV